MGEENNCGYFLVYWLLVSGRYVSDWKDSYLESAYQSTFGSLRLWCLILQRKIRKKDKLYICKIVHKVTARG